MSSSAKRQALHDISEWLKKEDIKIIDKNFDVWVVTGVRLDTKDQRLLNRELGIHKINKTASNMSRIKKKANDLL